MASVLGGQDHKSCGLNLGHEIQGLGNLQNL